MIQFMLLYFMIYCAKFQVAKLNINFLPPTWKGLGGVIKKLFNSILSAHTIDYMSLQNLVCSSCGIRETMCGLDREKDRRTDMACYIHSAQTNRPFFFQEK